MIRKPGEQSAKVPVVLPHVRVEITGDGTLEVTVDRNPRDVPANLAHNGRDAVPALIRQIATQIGTPVRVEVIDGGATFTDIVTPSNEPSRTVGVTTTAAELPGEVEGDGFLPDEPVAVAVVVAHQSADAHGVARLRLPPALLAGRPGLVILVGETSGAVALSSGTT